MSESLPSSSPANDLENLLSEARGVGEVTCSGLGFTLDQKKALQKVLEFSVNSLQDWALLVVQSASLSQAHSVYFTSVNEQFQVTWNLYEELELESFSADVLRPEQHLEGWLEPLRRACWASMRFGEIQVEFQDRRWRWHDQSIHLGQSEDRIEGLRFTFKPERFSTSDPQKVRTLLEERATIGPIKVCWDGEELNSKPRDGNLQNSPVWLGTANLKSLEGRVHCWHEYPGPVKERLQGGMPLLYNAKDLSPKVPIRIDYWCSLACEEFEASASTEYITKVPSMTASVQWLKNNVVVAERVLGESPVGCRVVLIADELRTDLSGLKSVPENFDPQEARTLLEKTWPDLRAKLLPLCSELHLADGHFFEIDLQSVDPKVTLKQRVRNAVSWGILGSVSALFFQAPPEAALTLGLLLSAGAGFSSPTSSSYGRMSRLVSERIEGTETLNISLGAKTPSGTQGGGAV